MRAPLMAMGQTLFEPPDVNGWELGPGWFSTGAMLARMNFASTIAANQRFNLAQRRGRREGLARCVRRVLPRPAVAGAVRPGAARYAQGVSGGRRRVDRIHAQLQSKAAGLARLIVGSAEYQLM